MDQIQPASRPTKTQRAHAVIARWHDMKKCHRIGTIFAEHPELGRAAYALAEIHHDINLNSPASMLCALIDNGNTEALDAVLALDAKRSAYERRTAAHPRIRPDAAEQRVR